MLTEAIHGPSDLSLGITAAGLFICLLAVVITYLATSDRGRDHD